MDFILVLLDSQRDFLLSPDNVKLVKSHLAKLKYDMLHSAFQPKYNEIMHMMDIADKIGMCLESKRLETDPTEMYMYPLSGTTDSVLMPFIDVYVFALNTICESVETIADSLFYMSRTIENEMNMEEQSPSRIIQMLQSHGSLSMLKFEVDEVRTDVMDMFEKFWDDISEPVRYLFDTMHRSISEDCVIPTEMQTLVEYMGKFINVIEEPESFQDLIHTFSRNPSVLLTTRIVMNMYLSGPTIDAITVCKDTVEVIGRCEKEDSMCEYADMSITTLFNCVVRNECSHVPTDLVEKLLFRIIKYTTGDGNQLTFNNISAICLYFFTNNIGLIDGYLVRHVAASFMTFLQANSRAVESVATRSLLQLLEQSKYFHLYLASMYDMETLKVLRNYLSPLYMDVFVESKSRKFTILEKDESAAEFHDSLTNSFIINPAILKVGDENVWVDSFMMGCHLRSRSENPYTRQPLQIEEWKEYNRANADVIAEYDKRLKAKLSSIA
jgi:hypothetical protein